MLFELSLTASAGQGDPEKPDSAAHAPTGASETVICVVSLIVPIDAVIVIGPPTAFASATPSVPCTFEIVAMFVLLEVHVACAVTSLCELSVNVAIAVNGKSALLCTSGP